MKKILYCLLILPLIAVSCVKDEADIFDRSAAERINDALADYGKILASAPNGWVMEYYIGEADRKGGYTFLCEFGEDGFVELASEFDLNGYQAKERARSLYQLKADQSAVLSFDTYNPILHYYSEPLGVTNPAGRQGDYDFIFQQVSEDLIVFKGKKLGNKMTLKRMTADDDWDGYLDKVMEMADGNYFPKYKIIVNGTETDLTGNGRDRSRQILFTDGQGSELLEENIFYTPQGFRFYEPVMVGGVEVSEFTWDEATSTFVSQDQGTDVKLQGYYPADYLYPEDYVGRYDFRYFNVEDVEKRVTVTLELIPGTRDLRMLNSAYFPIVLTYDRDTGYLRFYPQYVGKYNGTYDTYMYFWMGGTRLMTVVTDVYCYIGANNGDKTNTRIEFAIDDPMSNIIGYLSVAWTSATTISALGADEFFRDVVMTRQ